MFRLKRHVFPLYYLVTGGLVSIPFLLPPSSDAVSQEPPGEAKSEMIEVSIGAYEADGLRSYYGKAPKAGYLPEADLLTLEQLTIRYYSDGIETMSLRSESGMITRETIHLGGVVVLDAPGNGSRSRNSAVTEDVDIATDTWIATTSEEVELRQGGMKTTGRGMVADLRQGTVRLLDDTRTGYGY